MRQAVTGIALAGMLIALSAQPAKANESAETAEQRLVSLYQRYKDAVVKVKVATVTADENGSEQVSLTVLSGFFIDEQGTVLTNAVPTHQGPRIRVELGGAQLLALPIGSDPYSNIALLKLAKPPEKLSYVDLFQDTAEPAIGSTAFAITSPLEFAATPKMGLVSGQESNFGDIDFPFTYTRISISSDPAEGGSPVFNAQGQLIGASIAALPEIRSSYIVPLPALRRIVAQLRESQKVSHPTMGLKLVEQGSPIDFSRSVQVVEVAPDGPAAKAGLRAGDTLLEFQGEPITSLNALRDSQFLSQAGSFVTLTLLRGDEQLEIPVLLENKR